MNLGCGQTYCKLRFSKWRHIWLQKLNSTGNTLFLKKEKKRKKERTKDPNENYCPGILFGGKIAAQLQD